MSLRNMVEPVKRLLELGTSEFQRLVKVLLFNRSGNRAGL
jgi:hypothetical protein